MMPPIKGALYEEALENYAGIVGIIALFLIMCEH